MIAAQHLAAARLIGQAERPRRLPQQVPPIGIEIELGNALDRLYQTGVTAYLRSLDELPTVLASGRRQPSQSVSDNARSVLDRSLARFLEVVSTTAIVRASSVFAQRTVDHNARELGRQLRVGLGADVPMPDASQAIAPWLAVCATRLRNAVRETHARVEGWVMNAVSGAQVRLDDVAARIGAGTEIAEPIDLALANVEGIKRIANATREKIAAYLAAGIESGDLTVKGLEQMLRKQLRFGAARARAIAQDQVTTLYGQINAQRQRQLGIEKFRWVSRRDRRVRPRHRYLHGRVYAHSNPPPEGKPGEPWACRCIAEPVLDSILEGEDRLPAARRVPAGFAAPDGSRMIDGVPSYKGLDERALYVIPAGENRGRFIALPGGGADEIRVQSIRDAWDQGKRLQPLKMVMLPDGRLYVDDGRHRTIVAAQQGRDILVRIGRAATGLDIGTVPLIPH